MSGTTQTISQMPPGSSGLMSDIIPVTQGSTGSGSGTSYGMTTAKVLSSPGLVYAADAAYAGGVKADGSTDDTAAWTAALQAARSRGTWVMAPISTLPSLVSSITVPPNVGIIGRNVESYYIASSQGSAVLGSVIKGTTSSSPTVVMSAFSQLQSLQINGNAGSDAVQLTTGTFGTTQIFDVTIFGALNGINFAGGASLSRISHCRIHECTNGINNPTDAQITDNIITNCANNGILLSGNNARCLINGNRISACNININLNGTSNSAPVLNIDVTGNIMHDSGANNIYMNYCRNIAVTGNMIGCGGRSQASSPGNLSDANYNLTNCTGVIISGNSSWVSNNLTGYIGPFYAIYDGGGNTNCQFVGNILPFRNNAASATLGPINTTATFSNLAGTLNIAYWTATN